MKVTYLEHSGFAAEYKEYVLIFDWYRGSLPEFDQQKKIYVFASHSHYDHFNKKIFGWSEQYPDVRYILSADIVGKEQSEEQSERTLASTSSMTRSISLIFSCIMRFAFVMCPGYH